MPGPSAEMTAIVARWDPTTFKLEIVNCGHVTPILIRGGGSVERLDMPIRRGLGGRASPRPSELVTTLEPGDRLIICSDGVITDGDGRAGLGHDQVAEAALLSEDGSAADTVRKVHRAALHAGREKLEDDATVVCLAAE
jgi:serine phosphatase RsbU (regulator of sigma subunit)